MRLLSAYYLGRILTRPVTKSLKNFSKAYKKSQAERQKRIEAYRREKDRTVILRSTEEVNNALKLVRIEQGQQRIRKMEAEIERIQAQTAKIREGDTTGFPARKCPNCEELYSSGWNICPDCNVVLERTKI